MSWRFKIWLSFKFGKGEYVVDHNKEIWNMDDRREEERKESEVIQKKFSFCVQSSVLQSNPQILSSYWRYVKKKKIGKKNYS